MEGDKENNSRIARNTVFLYIRMFFAMVVALYTSRVLLRVLGVEDFGVNNVVAGFVSMFAFLNTSLTGAIQRYYNYEKGARGAQGVSQVYMTSLLIQLTMAGIVLFLLEAFGVWYLNNVMVIPEGRLFAANVLFQASSLSLFFLILSIPFSAAIVSFEHMDFFAIVGVLDVILKLIIVLVLPYVGNDKLITYSCLLLIVSIANFLLYFIYAKRHFRELRFIGARDKGLLKSMIVFSGWNFFGTFSSVVYRQGVNLLLNFFFGPIVNAARGISASVSSAISGFSSNIVMAFRPQMVESYAKENYSRTKSIMFTESKLCYLMLLLLIVPIVCEVNYLLHIWLGKEIPQYSGIFTILVLVNSQMATLYVPFTQVIHASGVMKKFQLITGCISCMIIPLGWVAFKFGLPPVSIFVVALFLALATHIACCIIVKQVFDYDIRYYISSVIIPLVITTIIAPIIPLLLHFLIPESFYRLVFVGSSSTIIIIGCSLFLVLNAEEKAFLISIIQKWKSRRVKS